MIIRPATPEDHPALAELFLATRRETFYWIHSQTLEDFAEQTAGEAIHVAEDEGGELLGFISVWVEDQFIHHLFISPQHQRRGVGRALLEDLAARLPGPFTLKCFTANTRALSFYHALGWRDAGCGEVAEGSYLLLEWWPSRDSPAR